MVGEARGTSHSCERQEIAGPGGPMEQEGNTEGTPESDTSGSGGLVGILARTESPGRAALLGEKKKNELLGG